MSTSVGSIHYELGMVKDKFDAGVKKVGEQTDGLGNKVKGGFTKIGHAAEKLMIGVAALGTGMAIFGAKSVAAYNESITAGTKLRTNLLNVKGATEENVTSLGKLAGALQNVGVIEDDVIIAGMSQLATFNLQGKTIEKLTPKITDMVAQLKGHNATAEDMVGINNLVGKVMTGNVGALSRYGVTLDDNSTKILTNGTEAEKAAELVKVLGQNYGEVNKALRDTPQGRITGLKNAFGDLMEIVGGSITAFINPIVKGFDNWQKSMGGAEGIMVSLGNAWALISKGDFRGGIFGLQEDSPAVNAVFVMREQLSKLKDVAAGIYNFLLPSFVALGNTIKENIMPIMAALKPIWKDIWVVGGTLLVGAIWLLINVMNFLIPVIRTLVEWISIAYVWFKDNILPVLMQVGAFIVGVFIGVWNQLTDAFRSIQETLAPFMPQIMMVLKVLGIIVAVIVGVVVIALVSFIAVWVAVIVVIARVIGWIAQFIAWYVNLAVQVAGAMARFVGAVINGISQVIGWFQRLPGNIGSAIGNAGHMLWDAGSAIMNGLWNGLKQRWEQVKNWVGGLGDKIKALKGPLNKDKVMLVKEGGAIMEGLNKGLMSGYKDVARTLSGMTTDISGFSPSGSTQNNSTSNTSIGNVNINSRQDADYFFDRMNRNQDLLGFGLASNGGA